MAKIYTGRYHVERDEPFIVFLIGMRINRLWAIHKWWSPLMATLRNLRSVDSRTPPEGYLGGEVYLSWPGLNMVQYWESFEHLENYSKDPNLPHLKAWQHLAKQSKTDHTFGYWHETYQVNPGEFECIYGNMPRIGLGVTDGHAPVGAKEETARKRLTEE